MKEEERQSFLNDLAIGGLLHDVGKLVQRATREKKNHMHVGGDWLKEVGQPWCEYAWAAIFHHTNPSAGVTLKDLSEPDKALKAAIISHADNLSASEREDVTGKWDPDVQLKNVFDIVNLNLKECEKKSSANSFFPIAPLDDEGLIMPKKDSRSKEFNYGSLEKGLLKHLKGSYGGPGWLLRVLERYTSFVPSDTATGEDRMPDISLFDHLRTTAMIAVCIGDFLREKNPHIFREEDPMKCFNAIEKCLTPLEVKPFLMVEGDIRGIQKYIYDISGKKALRGLRARSFYLEAVLESTLCDLLEELGVPRTQVLFVGGGHWILMLPNTESTITKLEEFKQALNKKLYFMEDGKLSLSLGWVSFGWNDLKKKINVVFKKMAARLANERCHPLEGLLEQVLGSQNDDYFSKSCTICGRRTDTLKSLDQEDAEGSACEHCWSLINLAKDISDPSVRYLYRLPEDEKGLVKILGIPYSTAKHPEEIPQDSRRIFVIKNPHAKIDKEDERFVPLPWAGYAWDNEIEKVLQDGCIGARKLGALRMDVDNLGKIFAEGLPESLYSLSRIATMSRLLTHFFKVYIPIIAQKPKVRFVKDAFADSHDQGRRLIVVYSGGDDLYVVGAWNEVAEFAIDVVERFREFTGDNPSVTISGGMIMADETAPIYSLAEIAGTAEESAKEHTCQGVQKDSLALFFTEELEARGVFDKKFNTRKELGELVERLSTFLSGAKLSKTNGRAYIKLDVERAFFRKIMALQEMEQNGYLLWRAHAAYAAGRSKKETTAKKVFSEMESAESDTLRTASVCAEWLDYLIR